MFRVESEKDIRFESSEERCSELRSKVKELNGQVEKVNSFIKYVFNIVSVDPSAIIPWQTTKRTEQNAGTISNIVTVVKNVAKFSITSKATEKSKGAKQTSVFFAPSFVLPYDAQVFSINVVFGTEQTDVNFQLTNDDALDEKFGLKREDKKAELEHQSVEQLFDDKEIIIKAGIKTKLVADCKINGRAIITLMYKL